MAGTVRTENDDFWVFGYGSLMWRPGFDHVEAIEARAFGFHRALCVRSFVHRGTPERPGLVLGLDRGGSCRGMVFRVRRGDRRMVLDYLRGRELVTHVYKERHLPVMLRSGARVEAIGYVVDRRHVQYAGAPSADEAAAVVRAAAGQSGPNADYLFNTLAHLRALQIKDGWLEEVAEKLARPHARSNGC